MFFAGILPGLLLAVGFLAVCNISARLRGFPYEKTPVAWGQMARRGLYAMPALLMPVLVLIALRFGVLTPTEISTSAVVYAMLVSGLLYRDLTWARDQALDLHGGYRDRRRHAADHGLDGGRLDPDAGPDPDAVPGLGQGSHFNTQFSVILLMNFMMLVAGMFIDLPAAILLLTPLFIPLAKTVSASISCSSASSWSSIWRSGCTSPPVGTTLFIGSMLSKARIGQMVKELLPFYAVGVLVLALMSYVPALTLRMH